MTDTDRASGSLPENHPLFAPGLCRRRRARGEARYWIPTKRDIALGFKPKSIRLPDHLSEDAVAQRCRQHWKDLVAWRKDPANHGRAEQYSIAWLINRYLTDEHSPYARLDVASRKNYEHNCGIIRDTIGKRCIDRTVDDPITGEDFWRWHTKWGQPVPLLEVDDVGAPMTVPSTPSRARHVITQLRMLLKYGMVIGKPGAPFLAYVKDLVAVITAIDFPTTPARHVAPDRDQAYAIAEQAIKDGWPSIALTTLAQFELIERRISIIGAWKGNRWRPGWVWTGVTEDWRIVYYQNKNEPVRREFDLKDTPRLIELMQLTPTDKRIGPIIICESTRLPWKVKHYTDTFREIARRAGVPDEVWSMDMRAGGGSEADNIPDVTDRQLQDAFGHHDPQTKERYRRKKQRNAQTVVQLRQKAKQ